MDSELTTVLVQICNELKGIRVALECLALLEAYDSNIASKSDQQRNRAKKNSGSISCASDLRKAKACAGKRSSGCRVCYLMKIKE